MKRPDAKRSPKHPSPAGKPVKSDKPGKSKQAAPQESSPLIPQDGLLLECEVLDGLKPIVMNELAQRVGDRAGEYITHKHDSEAITLHYTGDLHDVLSLRTVTSVYLIRVFTIDTPRMLVTHEYLPKLIGQINAVRKLHPEGTFQTFKISAAGESSSLFVQLRGLIGRQTGLKFEAEDADMVIRVRPSRLVRGWDVLVRLTPRPLNTREWRVYNYLGALNATLAAAMVELTYPRPRDRFLNLASGSGTILIERLLRGPAQLSIGCDISREVLIGSALNLKTAKVRSAQLVEMDATRLAFPDSSFDVLCADLPWGQLVGSHDENIRLYPRVLREAARVAMPGARFVLLTHEIKLMENILETNQHWQLRDEVKVYQGGLHPRIFMLQRSTEPV